MVTSFDHGWALGHDTQTVKGADSLVAMQAEVYWPYSGPLDR
jgi:hypothetical protein